MDNNKTRYMVFSFKNRVLVTVRSHQVTQTLSPLYYMLFNGSTIDTTLIESVKAAGFDDLFCYYLDL